MLLTCAFVNVPDQLPIQPVAESLKELVGPLGSVCSSFMETLNQLGQAEVVGSASSSSGPLLRTLFTAVVTA